MALRDSTLMVLLVARVEALDPTPWQFGGVADTWHEVEHPFGAGAEGSGTEHLAFLAMVSSSRPFIEEIDAAEMEDEQVAMVDFIFHFGLDPAAQMTSLRLASEAADQVCAAFLDHQSWGHDDVSRVTCLQLFQPFVEPGGQYVEVRQSYEIRYDRSRA